MNAIKPVALALLIPLLTGLTCPAQTAEPTDRRTDLLAELGGPSYIYELFRYLYQWYLDEPDVAPLFDEESTILYLQPLSPELDAGDRSRFINVYIPAFGTKIALKKSDYTIEKTQQTVSSPLFQVQQVLRQTPTGLSTWQPVTIQLDALMKYLMDTRNLREYPDEALSNQLRLAVIRALDEHDIEVHHAAAATEPPIVDVGPMSPVANELWIYWENGRLLFEFISDLDLSDPTIWTHPDHLRVRSFDIDDQVVVSLSQVPGSNAYLTRDQVGRILYNCLVLGQRRVAGVQQPLTIDK